MTAKDLLCYGCGVELGMTMADLARRLDLMRANDDAFRTILELRDAYRQQKTDELRPK